MSNMILNLRYTKRYYFLTRLDFYCFSSKSQSLKDKNISIINVTNSDDYQCRMSISDDRY